MKVIFADERAGELKLLVENGDDIWHLSNILTEDGKTLATMRTVRKVKLDLGSERSESEKVAVTLSIRVEKVEYHPFSGALRVSGKISSENDLAPLGSYHTFSVEPGDLIKLQKEGGISSLDLERIRRARQAQPKILILLIDRDEANFALVSGEGINWLASLESSIPSKSDPKAYDSATREYFERVFSALQSFAPRAKSIIVAGPGNAKENFSDFCRGKVKFSLANASSATKAALKDLLEGDGRKILEGTALSEENSLVERVFSQLGKNPDKVAYGGEQVRAAALAGAVERLLLTDSMIKKTRLDGTFVQLEETIRAVEKAGGNVSVISETHEAGQKISGLGGVVGLLRYAYKPA
ncbi:MAG: mRNA surveillance protein pelota [archaeon]